MPFYTFGINLIQIYRKIEMYINVMALRMTPTVTYIYFIGTQKECQLSLVDKHVSYV